MRHFNFYNKFFNFYNKLTNFYNKLSNFYNIIYMNDEYLISLTSIPRRLNKNYRLMVDNLKKQKFKCKILINIPYSYKKWGNYTLDENILSNDELVEIFRPSKDYGAATKLIGALDYIKKNENKTIKYVITVDDDSFYNNFDMIDTLVENEKKYKNCAITFGGIKLVKYPYKSRNGLQYSNIGSVDCPAGFKGVLYPISKFRKNDIIYSFMNTLPDGIFNDDDAYFGIILSLMDIEIVAIKNIGGIKPIPCSGKSGVAEKVDVSRVINEMLIFQYAVKNDLLPNKNKNY